MLYYLQQTTFLKLFRTHSVAYWYLSAIKQQIIKKLLTEVVDTFMLARVITYFDIIQNQTISYSDIVKYFKDKAYFSADNLIKEKFQINFQELIGLEDSLFLPSSFQ